ncbi:tetratricopeptide repeat protein [Candidatus Thermokryptus mobilis]|nr:tetratricopeptide repeat protein [Candidatus Thermokryptus mobilis]
MDEKISIAESLIASGQIEKAIEIYLEIFKSSPNDQKIAKRLSELYLWTENVQGAINVYEMLLKNGVSNYDVLSNLARWYLWNGRQNEAISIYEKLVEMFPDSANFYKMLAKLYVWNNQPRKAIPIYEKIIQLDPLDYETMIEFAQQLVWNDQQLKAIPIYKKLVKIFPDSLSFHWMLCQLLVWNNKTDEAKFEVEKFLKKFPLHKNALELAVQLFYYSGQWDKAQEYAKELLKIEPENQVAIKIINEIELQYSDYLTGEFKRLSDTNKLTKVIYPFEFKLFLSRFWEFALNFERVELKDDRVAGRGIGYGGVLNFKYNFSRGNSFELGGGVFRYDGGIFPVWRFALSLNLFDKIYPQFHYKRSENREGARAIEQKILIDDFTLTAYYQVTPVFGISFLSEYGIFSDGNIKRTFGSYFNLIFSKKNPHVVLSGFYAFEDFDSIYVNSIPYWTPSNLSTYWGEVGIEQGFWERILIGASGAVVVARSPNYQKYPTSLNYRFYSKVWFGNFEIYGLYERYGSSVYNYRFFRFYVKLRF